MISFDSEMMEDMEVMLSYHVAWKSKYLAAVSHDYPRPNMDIIIR